MSSDAPRSIDPSVPSQSAMREMLRLALPTVATMTSYTVMTFTDKFLCSNLGPMQVGAQGNGGLASWVAISVAHGTIMIVNTFVSQNLGAGRPERGPAYAWNAIWLGLVYWLLLLVPYAIFLPSILGYAMVDEAMAGERVAEAREQARLAGVYGQILVFGAVLTMATRAISQYFYGMHRAGVVLAAGVLANVFNIIVSGVLMFGNSPPPETLGAFGRLCHAIATPLGIEPMGVAGSAYGTVLATGVELLIPLCVFLGRSMNRKFGTRAQWRPSAARLKEILRVGWPGGIMFGNEMICWGFFMVYLVSHFGPQHASAGWIAHQYMSLSFMPAVGISVACTALVGKYQGMGRSDLAASRAWLGVKLAMGYMGLCAIIFVAFRHDLIELFVKEGTPAEQAEEIIRLGGMFLIATAAFQLFDAVAMVIAGSLRGAGDTVVPGVLTVALSWIVIVGGGLGLVVWAPTLGSVGPWIAAATYIALLCVALVARFLTGRWKSIKIVQQDRADTQAASTTDGVV